MEEPKVQQNRFRKPIRRFALIFLALIVFLFATLSVVLNSYNIQKRLFVTYVQPVLEEYQLSLDFNGFIYDFPSSFSLEPARLNLSGQPLAQWDRIGLNNLSYDGTLKLSSLDLEGLEFMRPLDSAFLAQIDEAFLSDEMDTVAAVAFSTLPIYVQHIILECDVPLSDTIAVQSTVFVENFALEKDLTIGHLAAELKVNEYNGSLTLNEIFYGVQGAFHVKVAAEIADLMSTDGYVGGRLDSIDLTGNIDVFDRVDLRPLGLEMYQELFEAAHIGFHVLTDKNGMGGEIAGGNALFNLNGSWRQTTAMDYTISARMQPTASLYQLPAFEPYREYFSYFKPNDVSMNVLTDFTDASGTLQVQDERSQVNLQLEGLNEPLRASIQAREIGLGPLQSANGMFSVLPSVAKVAANEEFKVLGVFKELGLNEDTVRGTQIVYQHDAFRDTIWLSGLDSLFDAEIGIGSFSNQYTVKGTLNQLYLGLIDPLDTAEYLSAALEVKINNEGLGSLKLSDVLLQRPENVVFLRAFNLDHHLDNGRRSLEVKSDVLNADISGRWAFSELPKVAHHIFQDIIAQEQDPWGTTDLKFSIKAGDINWLADLLHVDIALSDQTQLLGKYSGPNQKWSTTLFLPYISYENLGLQEAFLNASSDPERNLFELRIGEIAYDSITVAQTRVLSNGGRDKRYFEVQTSLQDSINSDLLMQGELYTDSLRLSRFAFNINRHNFNLVRSALVSWPNHVLAVDSFGIAGTQGALYLDGSLGNSSKDRFHGYIKEVQGTFVSELLDQPEVALEGLISSDFHVKDLLNSPEFTAYLGIQNLELNTVPYGDLRLNARFTEKDQLFATGGLLFLGANPMSVNLRLNTIEEEVDLRASLDGFNIAGFNPFLSGIMDELEGEMQGGIELYGGFDSYSLRGDFTLNNGHFTVPVVGAELATKTPVDIRISEEHIILDSALFYVPKDSTMAFAWGEISHERFDNIVFDLRLHGDSIRAVDMDRVDDGFFYGEAIVFGDVLLEGPLEQLHLDLNLATKDGTNFKIPLDNPTAVEMPSFLRFTDDSLPKGDSVESVDLEYFTTDIAIAATPDAAIELVLDEVLGDVIKARGSGNLRMKLLEDESLELYGLYTLESGDYLFTLQNVINKPFEIVPGGTILWSGDLLDATININAKYSLSTDLQGLVTSTSYNNENVDVDLIINLSGALMNPDIAFSVDLPNSPQNYLEELQRHFLTEDAMNYQAFSLLMLGDFYKQELGIQEGINVGTSVTKNTSELLVSEFGSWLAAGIGSYVDLELDYTTGNNPYAALGAQQNNLNLAVGKNFLDGRLAVNSSLDIPVGGEGPSTLLLGDTEVVFSVTKDGRIKLRAFNRSNRNDPLMQNSGPYTQGVGILFHKEFDRVLND